MQHDEIQQIFLLECDEGLDIAERSLLACKNGNDDPEAINSIFRAVHSIKGGAGAFGFTPLQAFTHKFETVLQQVRDGDKPLTPDLLATLIRAFDVLTDHVSAIKDQVEAPNDAAISAELETIADAETVAEIAAPLAEAAPEPEPAAEESDARSEDEADPSAEIDFDDLLADLNVPDTAEGGHVVHLRPQVRALDNGGDPLLFIESLPRSETRDFVEQVLTNFWIYRAKLGQKSPSKEDIVQGRWPSYVAMDAPETKAAEATLWPVSTKP